MKIFFGFLVGILWILFGVLPGTCLIGEAWHQANKDAESANETEITKHNGVLLHGDNHLYGINFCKIIVCNPMYWVGLALIIFFTLMCFTNLFDYDLLD
jgi:hypothetical protein